MNPNQDISCGSNSMLLQYKLFVFSMDYDVGLSM